MALPKSGLAVVVAMFMSAAWAEGSPMPEDIAWKLLELGRVIDPPKTAPLYAPLQEKEPYQSVKIERDVNTGLPIAICSISLSRTQRHRHALC
jgi:hypothetical protein